jgi:hypothetical protein
MCLAKRLYLYSKVYIVQLTKTEVLAYLLILVNITFSDALKSKHSRTFSTKHFSSEHRLSIFWPIKMSVQISFIFRVKELGISLQCQLVKLTSPTLQIFYQSLYKFFLNYLVYFQISVSPDSRNTAWVSFDGRKRQELLHGDRYVNGATTFAVITFGITTKMKK